MRLLSFTPGTAFLAMPMLTAASEQELSAATDRTAETAMDFMAARVGDDVGGGRRGERAETRRSEQS